MTLTDFLLERITEDERAALAADEHWHSLDDAATRADLSEPSWRFSRDAGSPARILAACAAKRRVVEFYLARPDVPGAETARLHDLLRRLAGEYAAHPDYDESWRP